MPRVYQRSVLIGVLLALVTTLPGLAQEASPTAVRFPLTPEPALCQIAPRPEADLFQFVGTPDPVPEDTMGAAGTPELGAMTLPAGEPADTATTAAVITTVVELFACYNANDYLRAYNLWTEDALESVFGTQPWTEQEMTDWLATPGPFPTEQWIELLGVHDVVVLPEGRVSSMVEVAYPDGTRERQVGLAKLVDGRYRLDELLLVTPLDATPAAGTPAP